MQSQLALLGGKKSRNKPFPAAGCFGAQEKRALEAVIDSKVLSGFIAKAGDHFLGGKFVRQLESDFCRYFKSEFAIACNSATAGLHMAVAACDIGPGDEVITTPYTMSATATSILMQNAVPVFADIEEDKFCLRPKSIEQLISPSTKATIWTGSWLLPENTSLR
jgi:perosamine synthetase